MANINVAFEQMEGSAHRLRAGRQEIEEKLSQLRQLVQALVQDGFTTTSASGAFDASYSEFTVGATSTVQGLDGMARFLENAARVLQETDEALARQISAG